MSRGRIRSVCAGTLLVIAVAGAGSAGTQEAPRGPQLSPRDAVSAYATRSFTARAAIEPEAVFAQLCVPCHGDEGKGDGPAAAAFTPRPADLTDSDMWVGRSDQEILALLTNGKGSMPAFGGALSTEVREALVQYMRRRFQPSEDSGIDARD